jgi:hypothetical protein
MISLTQRGYTPAGNARVNAYYIFQLFHLRLVALKLLRHFRVKLVSK